MVAAFKSCVTVIDIMVCAHVLFVGHHQHGQARQACESAKRSGRTHEDDLRVVSAASA